MGEFELHDLTGMSKPLAKLVDGHRSACGASFEPSMIVRRAAAQAQAAKIAATSEIEISDLRRRAAARVQAEQLIEQSNIEAVVAAASAQIGPDVSDEPVDVDWMARLLRECRDIRDPEVQSVWGRVLAGETERPGSFALRTLDVLRQLSKREAEEFRTYCGFCWHAQARSFCMFPGSTETKSAQEKRGLDYEGMLRLQEAGLVVIDPTLRVFLKQGRTVLNYARKKPFGLQGVPEGASLPVMSLTLSGVELSKVADALPDDEYEAFCVKEMTKLAIEVAPA